jgi:hypothetical protein
MVEAEPGQLPERSELLRDIGEALAQSEGLEIVADQMLGLDARIDLLARSVAGQIVLVLVAARSEDLLRLGDALAQRSWAAPRGRDWAKLAPGLGLRPELGVRTLLLAPSFEPRTLAAALSLGPDWIELRRYRAAAGAEGVIIEPAEGGEAPGRHGATHRPRSVFRSGLRPEDLASSALAPRRE